MRTMEKERKTKKGRKRANIYTEILKNIKYLTKRGNLSEIKFGKHIFVINLLKNGALNIPKR